MKLPEFAVKRPVLTTMVFVGGMILGAVSFTRLRIDLLPEIDFPSISIVTTYEGAGPEEIETIITRPMERAVATVEGIERIESFSAEGRSRVALRFVWGTNLDTALNDVRAVVERIKGRLPEDVDNPVVYKFNLEAFPILSLGLSGSLDAPALRMLAERELLPRLERVEGVAAAAVRGGLKREVHVLLDSDRLRSLNISPTQVVTALREGNRNVPAGQVEENDGNVLVRSMGESPNAAGLTHLVITTRADGRGERHPILLGQVAELLDAFEEPSNFVYINGKPGIRLNINKQSGSNTVAVSQRVHRELEAINRDYHGRAELSVVSDTADYIKASITNVQRSVLIGAALAILVLLVALGNVRTTLIIATGIPISVIGIFTLMYYAGITLNLVSFGGVALGIGMLVDNAIVILENIFRKHEEGLPATRAAIEGAEEVATAIIASTATTLVVFLPVIFLTGFAAIFFGQMAFVVSFALLCSLAVALTLIPVLCSKLLAGQHAPQAETEKTAGRLRARLLSLEQRYQRAVEWALQRPRRTLSLCALGVGGSLALTPFIGSELMPEGDQSEVVVRIELPVGTRIEITDAAVRRLEREIEGRVPELRTLLTVIGTPGFWSTAGEEAAYIDVLLVPPTERQRTSEEVAAALRPALQGLVPGADIRVRAGGGLWILRMLRGGGERLEVQVRGHDLATASRLAEAVKETMGTVPGISGARISRRPGGRELRIVPDRSKLAAMGLSYAEVAQQLQTYLQGTRATVLRIGGDEIEVIVKMREEETQGLDAALDVPVVIPNIGTTPLRNIVQTQNTEGPLLIERLNQNRVVTVSAILTGGEDLGTIANDLREKIRRLDVPDSFSVLVSGETAEQRRTFGGLMVGVLLAIALVYMVMAAQFESLVHPLLIMLSVPFAAVGVAAALLLTGTTFNIQSFMGCIVLVGIVVNNAIVLVDTINTMRRRHGMAIREAVVLSAKRRLRPILMTTATTALALVPVAIGAAEGGETQAPLARTVIGGLLVSTAISLIIIPVLYDAVERRRQAAPHSGRTA